MALPEQYISWPPVMRRVLLRISRLVVPIPYDTLRLGRAAQRVIMKSGMFSWRNERGDGILTPLFLVITTHRLLVPSYSKVPWLNGM